MLNTPNTPPNPNHSPQQPDLESTKRKRQENMLAQVISEDEYIGQGIKIVDAVHGDPTKLKEAWQFVDSLYDALEYIESEDNDEQGWQTTEVLERAWRNPEIKELYRSAVDCRSIIDDDGLDPKEQELVAKLAVYRDMYKELSEALEENRVVNERLIDEYSTDPERLSRAVLNKVETWSSTEAVVAIRAAKASLERSLEDLKKEDRDVDTGADILDDKIQAEKDLYERATRLGYETEQRAAPQEALEELKARKLKRARLEAKIEAYSLAIEQRKTVDQRVEDGEKGQAYKAALREYAELKATEESKGKDGWFTMPIFRKRLSIGSTREKRAEALIKAEDKLKQAALEYITELTEAKDRDGMYEGNDDQERQQKKSDDAFNTLRTLLDSRVRQETNDILSERKEDHNWLRRRMERGVAAPFAWLEKTGKWPRRLMLGGIGALNGAAIVLCGVYWPVKAGVTVAADIIIGYGSRLAEADANLKSHQDTDGNAKNMMSDVEFEARRELAEALHDESHANAVENLANKMIQFSREQSYKDSDKLDAKAKENTRVFRIGAALGAVTSFGVSQWLSHDTVSAVGGGGTEADPTAHPSHGVDPADPSPTAEPTGADVDPTPTAEPTGHGVDPTNHAIDPADSAPSYDGYDNTYGSGGAGDVSGGLDSPVDTEVLSTGDFSEYEYPWDWASDTYGPEDAMEKLYEFADKAAQDGHTVTWHGAGANQWVEVDGISETQHVLSVLSQYTQ